MATRRFDTARDTAIGGDPGPPRLPDAARSLDDLIPCIPPTDVTRPRDHQRGIFLASRLAPRRTGRLLPTASRSGVLPRAAIRVEAIELDRAATRDPFEDVPLSPRRGVPDDQAGARAGPRWDGAEVPR